MALGGLAIGISLLIALLVYLLVQGGFVHLATAILSFRDRSFLKAMLVAFLYIITLPLVIIPVIGWIALIVIQIIIIKGVYSEGWLKSFGAWLLTLIIEVIFIVVLGYLGLLVFKVRSLLLLSPAI